MKKSPIKKSKKVETVASISGVFACNSDTGTNRKNNEDIAYCGSSPFGYMLLIADGMGGHRSGEVASKIACDTLSYTFSINRKKFTSKTAHNLLVKAFSKANSEIYKLADEKNYSEIGTTLCACIIYNEGMSVLSVGDSRLYILKDHKLKQISVDQTNIQFFKETGRIKTVEQEKKTRKLLLNAIGINASIVDFDEHFLKIDDFDKVFVCSDGVNSVLEDSEIEKLIDVKSSCEKIVSSVINTCLEKKVLDNVACALWEKKI